ncbi:MAG: hypothetical protein QME68_07995, partial [Elusimicrobiota bacterium]|nr:hypothetical protein [Elusimicrobiota bacterium]
LSKNEPISKKEWYNNNFDVSTKVIGSKLTMKLLKAEGVKRLGSCDLSVGYIARFPMIDKFDLNNRYLTSVSSPNHVFTTDLKIVTEYGLCLVEYAQNPVDLKVNLGRAIVDNSAAAIEFRDVTLGPVKFLLRGYNYGKDFRAELSERFSGRKSDFGLKTDPEFDRTGLFTEIVYMLPPKMVNVTYKGSFYRTRLDSVKDNEQVLGDYDVFYTTAHQSIWNYVDLYTEFVRGLKSRLGLEELTDRYGTFPTIFIELQGESPIGYGRFQVRLKDINSTRELGERLIYGAELKANLTERLQAYHRTVIVQSNYLQKNWSSSFYQIRYNIIPDIETYLEYGDGWPTDNLTYDDDIIKRPEIEMAHTVKLILKVNF